jgi:phage terminase large subunit-like protein
VREVGYDPWNATQLAVQLQQDGVVMVPVRQNFGGLTAATKEFEKFVLGRAVRHGGNPVLRWMVSNVTVTQDPAGNLKPDKKKSTEKIDGVVAAIMAIARASAHADTGRSRYEDEDLFFMEDSE